VASALATSPLVKVINVADIDHIGTETESLLTGSDDSRR
jgi:hypothetical protein